MEIYVPGLLIDTYQRNAAKVAEAIAALPDKTDAAKIVFTPMEVAYGDQN